MKPKRDKQDKRQVNKSTDQLIHKRKRRKAKKTTTCSESRVDLLINVFISTLFSIIILICDSSAQSSVSDSVELDASASQESNSSLVRFLDEPKDRWLLVGQPADLACLAETTKRATFEWERGNWSLGTDDLTEPYKVRYSIDKSLDASWPQSTSSSSSSGQLIVRNFSMHIKSVRLRDEHLFTCVVDSHEKGENRVRSHSANLTVVQPPTSLLISANQINSQEADQNNSEQLESFGGPELDLHPQAARMQTSSDDIVEIVAKQNTRLRLECRVERAKPQAELTWLDHEQLKVEKGTHSDNSTQWQLQELLQADADEPKLVTTRLVWSFQVQKHHSNQLLTCIGQHAAFDNKQDLPQLFRRELRRQLRLQVHYEPEVELSKLQLHVYEGLPLNLLCRAQAKPAELVFRWFIDGQLVQGANTSELLVERATRQLHGREIKCQVSNAVGSTAKTLQLAVRYAPSFVSHLLTVSGPKTSSSLDETQTISSEFSQVSEQVSVGQLKWPTVGELALASQLAIGFEENEDVQLRCDFDASPRPQQLLWFKINTNYSIQGNVTPTEADELIASGEMRAVFSDRLQLFADEHSAKSTTLNKRHISNEAQTWPADQQFALNYQQMSAELLEELAQLEAQSNLTGSSFSDWHKLEPIAADQPKQVAGRIHEPLSWIVSSAEPTKASQEESAEESSKLSLIGPSQLVGSQQSLLLERAAQVYSSSILLRAARSETVGKYLCKTRMAEGGFGSAARAIYLVKRGQPRIVSPTVQWAPAQSEQVQLECLCQLNTVIDNVTVISWSRAGKLLDVTQKRYQLSVERSPDLLYARSTLRVEKPRTADFGHYVCTVTNSRGTDSMSVILKSMETKAYVFVMMAWIAIGGVFLLACLVCMLIAFTPRRKLDVKLDANDLASNSNSDTKSPPVEHNNNNSNSNICDNQLNTQTSTGDLHCQLPLHQYCLSQPATPNGYEQANLSDSNASPARNLIESRHKLRSSLRQPSNQSSSSALVKSNSHKFAAIHESLEHKLQLGKLNQQQQQQLHQSESADSAEASHKSQTISELDRQSLINRIWNRVLMRPNANNDNSLRSRRAKTRPVISMPVSVAGSGQPRRSSLSLNLAANANSESSAKSNNLNLIGRSTQMVSSSANLIQDSTTASDGTVSSGRSSTNSSANHNHLQPAQASLGGQKYAQQGMWIQSDPLNKQLVVDQLDSLNQQDLTACSNLNFDSQTIYVNNDQSAYGLNNVNLYTSEQVASFTGQSCSDTDTILGYSNHTSPGWPSELSQPVQPSQLSHYQLPMRVTGDSYLAASQSIGRPCYASVCNKPGSLQQLTANNYGTLTLLQPQNPSMANHQLVPTSDAGDAYFESNYGTLLSRSSAYRTLGYANSPISNGQFNANSSSTSPSSSINNNHQQSAPSNNHLPNLSHDSFQRPLKEQTSQFSHQAVVQCDGSTISSSQTNQLDDNGMATHV